MLSSTCISFPHECTDFPLGETRDLHQHLIAILSLLSQLETSVCLAADYSKYLKHCGRGDLKLTFTYSSRCSTAKTIQPSHVNPACRLYMPTLPDYPGVSRIQHLLCITIYGMPIFGHDHVLNISCCTSCHLHYVLN